MLRRYLGNIHSPPGRNGGASTSTSTRGSKNEQGATSNSRSRITLKGRLNLHNLFGDALTDISLFEKAKMIPTIASPRLPFPDPSKQPHKNKMQE
jgi:hypothetical protein